MTPAAPRRSFLDRVKMAAAVLTGRRSIGYDAAKLARTNAKMHQGAGNSLADAISQRQGRKLQGVGRNLYRNVPAAKRALRHIVQRVIGTRGIEPQFSEPEHDAAWARFAASCGIRGESWREMQKLALCDKISAGNGYLFWSIIEGKFCIQAFEPEQLQTPTGSMLEPRVVNGVRYDDFGRPVEYYVRAAPPGVDGMLWDVQTIPADRVIHLYDRDRPSAYRGVSGFATGAIMLHDAADATFAEVQGLKLQAYAGLHFKPNETELGNPASPFGETFDEPETGTTAPGGSPSTEIGVEWQLGQTFDFDGEVKLLESNRPHSQFLPLISHLMRQWAVSVGVPSFVVEGDYSKANFSSSRMAELHAHPVFEEHQVEMIEALRKLVLAWLEWAALTGEIRLGNRTPEQVLAEAEWIKPGFPYVQPEQEMKADLLKRASGILTFDQHCARAGRDGQEQRKAIARARELDAIYGVDTSINPELARAVAASIVASDDDGDANGTDNGTETIPTEETGT